MYCEEWYCPLPALVSPVMGNFPRQVLAAVLTPIHAVASPYLPWVLLHLLIPPLPDCPAAGLSILRPFWDLPLNY